MKIASRATPEGLAGHMWPAGHGFSTTDLQQQVITYVVVQLNKSLNFAMLKTQ